VTVDVQPFSGPSMTVHGQRAEGGDRDQQPREVERGDAGVTRLRHEGQRHSDRDDTHRDQCPEDAVPGEVLEQQTARDGAQGDAHPDGRAPHPEGGGALAALGEGVGDDRQRRREDQRGTRTHDDAERDQRLDALDERGGAAGHGEGEEAEDERGAAAEAVAHAAHREDQRGEGEVVAVDDPQQLAGVGIELTGDARKRHVDDRGVEVDGQRGQAGGREEGGPGVHEGSGRRMLMAVTSAWREM